MDKTLAFTKRNIMEMSRDVLSYVFCVAFPIAMLVVMSVVNQSIPEEANMTIFRIDNLLGGIIVFGHTFLMLFTALTVSQDRYSSFIMRLYASPMASRNFISGYILPMILIGIVQSMVSVFVSLPVSSITGYEMEVPGMFLVIVGSIPSAVMFISMGLIFGAVFNRNGAPGVCSVVISLGSFIGGVWFDTGGIGGVIGMICKCLPFMYATKSVRSCIKMEFTMQDMGIPMIVTFAAAAVLLVLAIFTFRRKMRADLS